MSEHTQPEALSLGQTLVEMGLIAADEVRRLHEENFALAAGQCIYNDGQGLTCDEYGNQVCTKELELRRLHAQREELLASLNGLLAYFESGNSVPVSQATIKANSAEVIAARAAIAKVEASK